MRDLTLYHAMTASLPSAIVLRDTQAPDPDSTSCIFLERGHIIEYIQLGARKIVSLFFGPDEFVIPCHPLFSTLKSLDPVTTVTFTHRSIFRSLRQSPASFAQYEGVRKQYQEKVAERLRIQQTLNEEERYRHLKETQPWVFSLASRGDIASYLGVTPERLRELSQ